MTKKQEEELILISGLCFNNTPFVYLSDDQCDLLHSTSVSELIKLGFSMDQANRMMACCKSNMQRRRSSFVKSED